MGNTLQFALLATYCNGPVNGPVGWEWVGNKTRQGQGRDGTGKGQDGNSTATGRADGDVMGRGETRKGRESGQDRGRTCISSLIKLQGFIEPNFVKLSLCQSVECLC